MPTHSVYSVITASFPGPELCVGIHVKHVHTLCRGIVYVKDLSQGLQFAESSESSILYLGDLIAGEPPVKATSIKRSSPGCCPG